MAATIILYQTPGYVEYALMVFMKLFAEHGADECWRELEEFNREWSDGD